MTSQSFEYKLRPPNVMFGDELIETDEPKAVEGKMVYDSFKMSEMTGDPSAEGTGSVFVQQGLRVNPNFGNIDYTLEFSLDLPEQFMNDKADDWVHFAATYNFVTPGDNKDKTVVCYVSIGKPKTAAVHPFNDGWNKDADKDVPF